MAAVLRTMSCRWRRYLPGESFAARSACMSIILNSKHYNYIIMKFNLKSFWREILIGILIALLLWVSSADRPQKNTGSTDTVCVVDTVVRNVPTPERIAWRKVLLSKYDTIYTTLVDYDTTVIDRVDTSWLYADIPVQEYRDTAYYVRTTGWLDSISVYHPKCETMPVRTNPVQNYGVTIFANTQIGSGVLAPGVSMSVRKLQLGYNYDILQRGGMLTIGYRIR
jgi:hypothetical protein